MLYTKEIPGLQKTVVNIVMFLASIAIVTAVLTWERNPGILAFWGTLTIVVSCFVILYLFLMQFRREVLHVARKVFFILLAIIVFLVVTRIVTGRQGDNLLFLIPFAIIPVVIRTFYDARLALFILLITIMLAGFMVPDPFEFILLSFVAGMASIFTLNKVYKKTRLFFTSFVVIVSYSVVWMGINMMTEGRLPGNIWSDLLLFAGNGLMILVSFPLIFLFEQDFLLISDTTLLELADSNQPLLRKLAEEAPGSYQHSLQVANLAEEAARSIGANVLLVRTGGLYHDIGKIAASKYFYENLSEERNPHEELQPGESARIIINHVKNGVNLAKNYKLPVQIIDFIRTHHGTTVAYFFYKKFLDGNTGEKGMEKIFAYPGPKPFTKETAVVMMADAVEASSRSLSNYTEESISELVERIIYIQEQDGQYSEVPLTYKEMSEIKSAIKRRLANIYHPRVAYPERI